MPTPSDRQELQLHRGHLISSLMLLDKAAPGWTGADRERGLKTIDNLTNQVAEIDRNGWGQ